MSSLHERPHSEWRAGVAVVQASRLDNFVGRRIARSDRLALWVDVEGAAYEALQGAAKIAAAISLIHVEVENTPCIASSQRLYPEVKDVLSELGFVELATDQPPDRDQFNALFVRRDLAAGMRIRVNARVTAELLRYRAAKAVHRVFPRLVPAIRRAFERSRRT
jgi:hypothetical protein